MTIDCWVCPDYDYDSNGPFTSGWHRLLWCIRWLICGKECADKKWEEWEGGTEKQDTIDYIDTQMRLEDRYHEAFYPELYEVDDDTDCARDEYGNVIILDQYGKVIKTVI